VYFDSHCHLDRIDLDDHSNSFQQLLENIRSESVTRMICIGVNLESFDQMYAQIEPHDDIYCSAGVHPDYQQVKEPTVDGLCHLASREKVVAIGETGLDYMESKDGMDWQRTRFSIHIEAAKKCQLPLIIHSRNAKQDTLALLREQNADTVGGVLHCFTEDWEMARQAIELGFYISISGIVTFHQADNVREMAKMIPADRLLIETDSPWLSPAPYRGKTNHPGRVRYVAEKLAEIRGESLTRLARTTYENTNRLFNL
jgi:TatD DNase family protein